VNGQSHAGIARLTSSGALDSSFNPSVSGAVSTVYTLALQGDGRILLGGLFAAVSGSPRTNIARLNTDGTLDTTFKPVLVGGGQFSLAAFYISRLMRKRVVAGGDFMSVNGLVRTNPLDSTTMARSISASCRQRERIFLSTPRPEQSGRILIAGYFSTVNGVDNNYIARLNIDGSFDPSFDTGSAPVIVVYSVALQPDGKVLVGGAFTEFNGTSRGGITGCRTWSRLHHPRSQPLSQQHCFQSISLDGYGKSYTLQFKNALSDSSWSALTPVTEMAQSRL